MNKVDVLMGYTWIIGLTNSENYIALNPLGIAETITLQQMRNYADADVDFIYDNKRINLNSEEQQALNNLFGKWYKEVIDKDKYNDFDDNDDEGDGTLAM